MKYVTERKRWSSRKVFRPVLALLLTALMTVSNLNVVAPLQVVKAEEGDVPAHEKTLHDNGDGTYTLSLNVTGDYTIEESDKATPVDIVLVVDESTSMNYLAVAGDASQNNNGEYFRFAYNGEEDVYLKYADYAVGRNGYRNYIYESATNQYYYYGDFSNWQRTYDAYNGYTNNQNNRYTANTRVNVIKNAVETLSDTLFNMAGSDVRISVVTFGSTADTATDWYTSAANVNGAIKSTAPLNNATNWQGAILNANAKINAQNNGARADAQKYIIFLSDGEPTARNSGTNNYNSAVTAANARANGVTFFSVSVATESNTRMNQFATAVNSTNKPAQFYDGSDPSKLTAAFNNIVEHIQNALGISDVSMNDGTTSKVSVTTTGGSQDMSLLVVDTSSFKYYRKGGKNADGSVKYDTAANNGLGVEWTGENVPAASLNANGQVIWDLGDGLLDDEVTYTVTFKVWPSQTAYDLIADLNNGTITDQDLEEMGLDDYIIGSKSAGYSVLTNTSATLTYTDTRLDNPTSTTVDFVNPEDGAGLSSASMRIQKKWSNDIDSRGYDQVALEVFYEDADGTEHSVKTVYLNAENNWTSGEIFIAPGLEDKNGTAYAGSEGHDYYVKEVGFYAAVRDETGAVTGYTLLGSSDYYFDLDAEVLHPMLKEVGDGTGTALHYGGADNDGTLVADNLRRSYLDFEKVVEAEEGTVPDPNQKFTFQISLNGTEGIGEDIWYSYPDPQNPQNFLSVNAGSASPFTVELPAGVNYRITNLPDGTTYTVEEINIPDNYSVKGEQSYSGEITANEYGPKVTITNTYDLVDVTVTKVWDDNDNQDGIRTPSVPVKLRAGNDIAGEETLDASKNWTYTWKGLPKSANGSVITYSVEETTVPTGYEAQVTGSMAEGFTITNKHEPETVDIQVVKVWDDNNNQDGKRPTELSVDLMRGEETIDTVTLKESEGWTATVSGLPKYSNGNPITYTWEEENLSDAGYTLASSVKTTENNVEKTTLTNRHAPEETSATVRKVWDDNDNQDGKRPTELSVDLMRGNDKIETVTLKESEGWTATVSGLPKNIDGKPAVYTWVEENLSNLGYTKGEAAVSGTTTTLTNIHTPETVDISVTKAWDDNNNQDGYRAPVTFELFANGETTGQTFTLEDVSGDDAAPSADAAGQTVLFRGLPKYAQGQEIAYTVKEITNLNAYTTVYQTEGATAAKNGETITNQHEIEKRDVIVTKEWIDNNNQDGLRGPVEFMLYANGDPTKTSITLDGTVDENGESAPWVATFADLDRKMNGDEILYTVVEENQIDGYQVSYYSDGAALNGEKITNTHVPETTSIMVMKEWVDDEDHDGLRKPVVFALYADGEETGKTITLDGTPDRAGEVEEWVALFDNLAKYADGEEIVYSVKEQDVPAEYTVSYRNDNTVAGGEDDAAYDGGTVVNTHEPVKINVSATKVWDDEDNQDGLRTNVDLFLAKMVGGKAELIVDTMQTITLDGEQTVTWEGVDKYENGAPIAYTVIENPIEGYGDPSLQITTGEDGNVAIIVTNSHTPETINISGTKVWNDEEYFQEDGTPIEGYERPESVTIEVYNGEEKVAETTTTELDGWAWEIRFLDKYANGQEITYTVKEAGAEAYDPEIVPAEAQNEAETEGGLVYTVTNTPKQKNEVFEPVTLTITKVDSATKHPLSGAVFTVVKTNTKVEEEPMVQTSDETGVVTFTFTSDGTYTMTEQAPEGYEAPAGSWNIVVSRSEVKKVEYNKTESVWNWFYHLFFGSGTDYENGTMTVENGSQTTSKTVRKIWNDEDNRYRTRPDTLTMTLMRGEEEVGSVELSERSQWTGTISGLAAYEDGQEITYTWVEEDVPGYTPQGFEEENGVTVFTNALGSQVSLTLTQIVEGSAPAGALFDFDITLNTPEKTPVFFTVTDASGAKVENLAIAGAVSATDDLYAAECGATIHMQLKHGDKVSFMNLPAETTYVTNQTAMEAGFYLKSTEVLTNAATQAAKAVETSGSGLAKAKGVFLGIMRMFRVADEGTTVSTVENPIERSIESRDIRHDVTYVNAYENLIVSDDEIGIIKYDSATNERLAGAEFTLQAESMTDAAGTDLTAEEIAAIAPVTVVTGTDGTATVRAADILPASPAAISYAKYTMSESKAPFGYKMADPDKTYVVEIAAETSTDESGNTLVDYTMTVDGEDTIMVANELDAEIITKIDETYNGITVNKFGAVDGEETAIDGAAFELYQSVDGKDILLESFTAGSYTLNLTKEWADRALGNVYGTLGIASPGAVTLYIKETKAPSDYYIKDETPHAISVWKDAATQIDAATGKQTTTVTYGISDIPEASAASASAIRIVNQMKVRVTELVDAAMTVNKVAADGTALAGATFGLYADAACTELIRTYTGGTFTIDTADKEIAAYLPDKEAVTLYLKETEAPAGYVKADTAYTVTIAAETVETVEESQIVSTTTYTVTADGLKEDGTLDVVNRPEETPDTPDDPTPVDPTPVDPTPDTPVVPDEPTPDEPDEPVEIDDGDTPLAPPTEPDDEEPDEPIEDPDTGVVEIEDEDAPRGGFEGDDEDEHFGGITIEDEDIPFASPKTGDPTSLAMLLGGMFAAAGTAVAARKGKKKEDEEE